MGGPLFVFARFPSGSDIADCDDYAGFQRLLSLMT